MSKILYEKDGRIGRITLNRPEAMNAIDDDVPRELAEAVERANADRGVHVIVLSGNGPGFCAGYDLTYYAQSKERHSADDIPLWDPMQDYAIITNNSLAEAQMSSFEMTVDRLTGGDKEQTVFVRGDKAVDYGQLMEVMDQLRAAGYLKIGLVGLETVGKQ